MRTEAVLRVILNAKLVPGLPVDLINERYVQFVALDTAGSTADDLESKVGKPAAVGLTKFLVKVAKAELAGKLLEVLKRYCDSGDEKLTKGDSASDSKPNDKVST